MVKYHHEKPPPFGEYFWNMFSNHLKPSNKSKEAEMALLKGQSLAPEVMQLVNARNNDLWEKCFLSTCLKMRFYRWIEGTIQGNPEENEEFTKRQREDLERTIGFNCHGWIWSKKRMMFSWHFAVMIRILTQLPLSSTTDVKSQPWALYVDCSKIQYFVLVSESWNNQSSGYDIKWLDFWQRNLI